MFTKSFIVFLTLASIGMGLYLYSMDVPINEVKYGASEILFFSIPFTMLLVNIQLFIFPKLFKFDVFTRYKKGIESIFLSLSIILALLYVGLILAATGREVNILLFIPVCAGIVLITTANTLPRFQLEIHQTSSEFTQSTNQAWNIIIRPFSYPLFIGGIAMLLCVFLPDALMLPGFLAILLCTLLISIIYSYRAYQSYVNRQ
ncbi:immunity protein, SdpI family [Cytobacillus horneckiae]|nr:hypothetical protein [Cytobacillus horneckiae]MBN6886344.1 hypothetical protein [Cytobacillus horneckiae]MCM3176587.1 hypothetical protein [Cytobacillus horneckiae]